jgi:hypothetical protein
MTFRRLTYLLYPALTTYEQAIAILPSAECLSLVLRAIEVSTKSENFSDNIIQRNEICITLCANFFYDEIFRKHKDFSIAQTW